MLHNYTQIQHDKENISGRSQSPVQREGGSPVLSGPAQSTPTPVYF